MPSDVSSRVGFFDRFAGYTSDVLGRAMFFSFCVILVVLWAPTLLLLHGNVNTWQLIINTITTIITFLMVALLQNSQTRSDHALQHKLNAIAKGLADLMAHEIDANDDRGLAQDLQELADAVGLEEHESTGKTA
jgi:low affinity Fe/Cu permease